MRKGQYLISSLAKHIAGRGLNCPSCGTANSTVVDRKILVTALRRCNNCELLFRTPTTSVTESLGFYQRRYAQGFTTEMPTEQELAQLIASNFVGSPRDYSNYLLVLDALGVTTGKEILDYGCSWGYGTWQLQNAGYKVQGYEVSKIRCQYAREKLLVDAVPDGVGLKPHFDCFFSAHVLEHVPIVSQVLTFARQCLRPGGLFVAFTPNGSDANRNIAPSNWHRRWGFVHPQLLDERFCRHHLSESHLVASSPYDPIAIRRWDKQHPLYLSISGDELLIVFRK